MSKILDFSLSFVWHVMSLFIKWKKKKKSQKLLMYFYP